MLMPWETKIDQCERLEIAHRRVREIFERKPATTELFPNSAIADDLDRLPGSSL